MSVEFFAAGECVPQGSMSAFAVPGTKHISIVPSNKRALDFWRGIIHSAAADAVYEMYAGPLAIEATFQVKRPISLPRWKLWVQTAPDLDKYARALLDAMTGVVYANDGQVARLAVEKVYAEPGQQLGVQVLVREIIEERLLGKKSQMSLLGGE